MCTFSWMSALLCDQIHSAASVNTSLFLLICHREEVPTPGAGGDQHSTRTEELIFTSLARKMLAEG